MLILIACISYNIHKYIINVVYHIHQEMVNDTNNQFHIDQSKFFQYILQLVYNLFEDFDRQFQKKIHVKNLPNPKKIN